MPNGDFERLARHERERIGRRLQQAREEAKLTQQEAASRIGISQSAISRFEMGDRGLDLAELKTLLRAYGKTLSDFLREGDL